jgi:hypothetical protein
MGEDEEQKKIVTQTFDMQIKGRNEWVKLYFFFLARCCCRCFLCASSLKTFRCLCILRGASLFGGCCEYESGWNTRESG